MPADGRWDLNFNFSKEHSMLPEDYRMIETCRVMEPEM